MQAIRFNETCFVFMVWWHFEAYRNGYAVSYCLIQRMCTFFPEVEPVLTASFLCSRFCNGESIDVDFISSKIRFVYMTICITFQWFDM